MKTASVGKSSRFKVAGRDEFLAAVTGYAAARSSPAVSLPGYRYDRVAARVAKNSRLSPKVLGSFLTFIKTPVGQEVISNAQLVGQQIRYLHDRAGEGRSNPLKPTGTLSDAISAGQIIAAARGAYLALNIKAETQHQLWSELRAFNVS